MAEYSMKKKTNFTLIQLAQESYLSFQATIVLMSRRNAHNGGTPGASGVHPLVRPSSPFPMVTKLAMYNVDDAGTEFSAKNNQKNHLMGIFAPISTFRPIGDQNFNSIR